jgi:hypothetical protein
MLIGLGKMVKKVVDIIVATQLVTKILGFTNIQVPGGSGYYTTTQTVGQSAQGYVNIGQSGETAYSYDGVNWTRTGNISNLGVQYFGQPKYLGGNFVTVANKPSTYDPVFLISKDGVSWSAHPLPIGYGSIYDINSEGIVFTAPLYISGKYILFTYNGYEFNSTDGITWTVVGEFLPGGYNNSRSYSVIDNTLIVTGLSSITGSRTVIQTRTEGSSVWSRFYCDIPVSFQTGFNPFVKINGKIFGFSSVYSDGSSWQVLSNDYINWTVEELVSSNREDLSRYITYNPNNGAYISFRGEGQYGGWKYSYDLTNWTAVTLNPHEGNAYWSMQTSQNSSKLYFKNNEYVLASLGNNLVAKSVDGITWTKYAVNTISYNYNRSVDYFDNKYFFYTYNGTGYVIGTSSNAIDWTYDETTFALASWDFRVQGNALFAYQFSNGTVAKSTNGITWTIGDSIGYGQQKFAEGIVTSLRTIEVQVSIGNQGTVGAEVLLPVTVYTTPFAHTTTTEKLRLTNLDPQPISVDAWIMPIDQAEPTNGNLVLNDYILAGNASADVTIGTIPNGYKLVILPSSVDDLRVDLYGTEDGFPMLIASAQYSMNYSFSQNAATVGQTWSPQIYPNPENGLSDASSQNIAYFNGRFYEGNNYSVDGLTWTNIPGLTESYGQKNIVVNDKIFNISSDSKVSGDGITWTSLGFNPTMNQAYEYPKPSIAYGNQTYVIVGQFGQIYYSADGITWTNSGVSGGFGFKSVAYGNEKFVAVGNGRVATSTDGISWNLAADVFTGDIQNIVYGSGIFWTYNQQGDNTPIKYSTDGIQWTSSTIPMTSINLITHANGVWAAAGNNEMYNYKFYKSMNGIDWSEFTAIPNAVYGRIELYYYANTYMVVNGLSLFKSSDGITWTEYAMDISNQFDPMMNLVYRP